MLTIEQGIITKYSDQSPWTCEVMQVPDHYIIPNVRLPQHISQQTKPLVDSAVLIACVDEYRSYLLCVIRDNNDFLEYGEGVRGADAETANFFQPGEIFLEAAGSNKGNVQISGTGGTLFLSNDGTVNLRSGKQKEYLILGGTDDDNDGEVLLVGDKGFFESNISSVADIALDPTIIPNIRSYYRFTQNNTLELGNSLITIIPPPVSTEVETLISQLQMTNLGKITLQNLTLGVPNAVLEMAVDGKITLKNNFGSTEISNLGAYSFTNPASSITLSNLGAYTLTTPASTLSINNTGAVSLTGASLSVSMSGSITQTGSTINLNSGTFGVARIQDTVTSNIASDPAWWTFWSTLSTLISALPTTPLDGGATLKAGLATLFSTVPTTIISKITTGSSTVKAGG